MAYTARLFIFLIFLGLQWRNSSAANASSPKVGEFLALAAKHPDVQQLLNQAIQKSGDANAASFLARFHPCDSGAGLLGSVKSKRHSRIFYIPRNVEDGGDSGAEDKDMLIKRYDGALAHQLSNDAKLSEIVWTIEPDLLTASEKPQVTQEICIESSTSNLDSAYVIAHEIVHYVFSAPESTTDAQKYTDLESFSLDVLQRPGDEVDAYIFQLSHQIADFGLVAGAGKAAPFFNARGDFTGTRIDFAHYILNDLDYRHRRMISEFKSVITSESDGLVIRIKALAGILRERVDEEKNYTEALSHRKAWIDFFWPQQAAETDRLQRLQLLASASRARLDLRLKQAQENLEKLKKTASTL